MFGDANTNNHNLFLKHAIPLQKRLSAKDNNFEVFVTGQLGRDFPEYLTCR
jgi:hypothetical protein